MVRSRRFWLVLFAMIQPRKTTVNNPKPMVWRVPAVRAVRTVTEQKRAARKTSAATR
ncbi:hypothetical protein ACFUTV_04420 [Streptomyces sp. NPDC057298]|uniref:hypothetical protein n=1 Tax=Streptomyces sp. NPDC057298 TaxID=3346091 RepID=UPI00362FB127